MDAGITANIDPLLLAKQGRRISGELALTVLPRLAALSCQPATGQVTVDLQFSCDADQQCWLQGSVSYQLEVICQRCLEKMSLTIDSEINTLLVTSVDDDGSDHQQSDIDATQTVCIGKTTVAALIEDDLLLAMPMFAKHDTGSCQDKRGEIKSTEISNKQKDDQQQNPFAILATLKTKKKSGKKTGK